MWTTSRIGLLVGAPTVQAFDLGRGVALGASPSLEAALDALAGRRARLEVVLSDAHCRYLVMARPGGVRNRAELGAAMQLRFRALFGEEASWLVRHESAATEGHDFVAGADQQLVAELERRAETAGLRVVSIRPHWVAWARHFRRRTRRGAHWVVGSDGEWLSLGYLSDGQCRHARAMRLGAAGTDLADLLARERAFLADADPAAPVWCGGVALEASTRRSASAPSAASLWALGEP